MDGELIARGREATVYRIGDEVVWVGDGPDIHPECALGWTLCRDHLSPPHFPEIYDITSKNGRLTVKMEYIPGSHPVEWDEGQAQEILDELRDAGVFHRDIRLPNLIVREDGTWCLVDFGWACTYDDPYPGPRMLGGEGRTKGGPDDEHAMQVIKRMLSHEG